MNDKRWPVLVHLNATSMIDEGTETVFDIIQQKVDPTGVLVAAHGFNPEIIDRGRTWPGHGPQGSHAGLGGYYAQAHDHYYEHTGLGSPQVRDAGFTQFDAMAAAAEQSKQRGLDLHVYILESAGTGGFQRNVANWTSVLEIDVDGRRSKLPCVNHPAYRAWKLALLDDLYTSYEFSGLLWGVERWGPLHQVVAGEQPGCFCEHCRTIAVDAGLDWTRVRQGYVALRDAVVATRKDGAKPRTLRLLLDYPEILAWEARWTEAYLSLHRELYGAAKWLAPDRSFGLGLWHYYFINPLLQAEWDMRAFAASSDYIRPILYHLPEGPRIKRHLGMLSSMFGGMSEETIWAFFAEMLDLELPPPQAFATAGLPADYVRQGVETIRRNSGNTARIIAGIGVDVFEHGLEAAMTPADTEAAIRSAAQAGADGITLARNYAEMQHVNLEAAGRTVKALSSAL